MAELAAFFPSGVKYEVSYDVTPVIAASVKKVLLTLAEAIVLVFVVMFLFLQNVRYTLIPTIVVPIALLGTCAALLAIGFSINVLTMFGMVLAIGILVDDAIVVVENVERIMVEEGLPPREATFNWPLNVVRRERREQNLNYTLHRDAKARRDSSKASLALLPEIQIAAL
jgi:multidrug efflux pump